MNRHVRTSLLTWGAALLAACLLPSRVDAWSSAGITASRENTSSSVTLRWTKATDNVSAQTALQYEVRMSTAANLGTLADAEANGTIVQSYSPDIDSVVVPNLSPGVTYYFNVIVKDEAENKAAYKMHVATAPAPPPDPDVPTPIDGTRTSTSLYSFPAQGAATFLADAPASPNVKLGHAEIDPAETDPNGAVVPAGVAIMRFAGAGGLIFETGMPLSEKVLGGSVYVESGAVSGTGEAIRTAVALSNSSAQDAVVSFSFDDETGVRIRTGNFTLPANQQVFGFLDQSPYGAPAVFKGTFTFGSSGPIGAVAVRSVTRTNGETLYSSLPVVPPGGPGSVPILPIFVVGEGWLTEVVLMNTSDTTKAGTVQFFGSGSPETPAPLLTMKVNGAVGSTFNYAVAPRSVARLITGMDLSALTAGSIRLTPAGSDGAPDAFAILSSKSNGMTITEASFAGQPAGNAFRLYVESSPRSLGWVSSGLTIVNASDDGNVVNFEFNDLQGTSIGAAAIIVPPRGHISRFVHEVFPSLPDFYKGVVRVTASGPVGVAAVRSKYNEKGHFLIASIPAWNEANPAPSAGTVFPLIRAGAGFQTELFLFGPSGQSGSGSISFYSQE